ncbi:MAG: 50S ribosomal protein L25 [Patescibacteria group bacterium]
MLELKAEKREVFGKKLKGSRLSGKMPIVAYGHKEKVGNYFVDLKEFKKVFGKAGESAIISLATGTDNKEVLIHEVNYHPVSNEPIHADFYVIEKGKALKIKVPLEFIGHSSAVKELGGILVKSLHELEIEALPKDLPPHLTLDISLLTTLESQILVKDIKLPNGVKVINKPEEVVASIDTVKEEVEEVAPVDLSAIEVEKKGKKEEEGAEAVAPGAGTPAKGEPTKSDKKPEKK